MKNIKETKSHIEVEFENNSGKKYVVGYPKEAGYNKDTIKEELTKHLEKHPEKEMSDSDDWQSVKWSCAGDTYTSPGAKSIGIEAGNLNCGGTVYTARCNFENSSGWGFHFKDAFGYIYFCSTIRNGWHYIDYNSPDPTMVGVE